jgi:large subunit ribosomal protein L6
MSRIGKKPIVIPSGVTIAIDDNNIEIKGPKGTLVFQHSREVSLEKKDNEIIVVMIGKTKAASAIWGTTQAVIQNMVIGVTQGFEKRLELNGVGYKMAVQGKKLVMSLGFSHPVELDIPVELTTEIEKNILIIKGIDKQKVGQFAAEIRALKKVEPYKGKGFKYVDEVVVRKEGKRAAGEK